MAWQIAVGNSSTSQAAHIMAALSKGSGYALPADLQFLDSRWYRPRVLFLDLIQAAPLATAPPSSPTYIAPHTAAHLFTDVSLAALTLPCLTFWMCCRRWSSQRRFPADVVPLSTS